MELSCVKYVLLDIEGTVLPISFVKDVLFVYARRHLEEFLEENWLKTEVQHAVKEIQKFAEANSESPAIDITSKISVVKNVSWQMDRDLKTAGLKALQGQIWYSGYKKRDLLGDLYPDVYPALKKWSERGIKIGIYSSGSILAQRLLFEHTTSGSLLNILDSFHDQTTAGSKLEPSSYAAIVEQISCPAENILFLTDVYEEYQAARAAGIKSVIVLRDGNKPLGKEKEEKERVKLISTFHELQLD
ncbi:enolase-phosphatase E1-like [Tropilaelaps mercedesae]|uniref:Enolase-phosphatase E1-like n=1 Tax=Tropilaelaps mercedesae TaxID=418985 RepID=A0A1V9XUR0_9ACAR|nr:enolase-phosphatase E1-like [Tropilaelaps mercedesae]